MMASAENVARLVRLNGGTMVGKTRLQKSAYFLEEKGVGSGFDFSYHHYGPYSEELSACIDDALALGLMEVSWQSTQSGMSFAVFNASQSPTVETASDLLRRRILSVLARYSSVELELAATASFLQRVDNVEDAWRETRRRKSSKVTEYRISRSNSLLRELREIS